MKNTISKHALLSPENFIYWLQGFAELNKEAPNTEQWKTITEHLNMCFDHAVPGTWQRAEDVKPSKFDNDDLARMVC